LYRTSLHSPTQGTGDKRPSSTLPFTPCSVSLVFCSVSLCSVRSVGPLNRTSLHSPTQDAGGRQRNTCFSISLVYVRNVLLLVLVHQLVAEHVGYTSLFSFKVVVFRMQYSASCPGWYSTPRFTKFPSSSFLLMKQNPSNKRL
jgi:hypothetical protein